MIKLQIEPPMNKRVAITYPDVNNIILQMTNSNNGALNIFL